MFLLAFVAGWLQGHWWGFISRNYVVWPTFLLMNVFIALKGSHFWFLFDVNKASGPDLISPNLIKESMLQLVNPFTRSFNLSLRLKTVPDPWKESNVIPVHKKDNTLDPNNYRPISLLSNVGKLMERCVHKHLNEYLTTNNIITPNQSGFQSGESTVNQLLYLNTTFLKL